MGNERLAVQNEIETWNVQFARLVAHVQHQSTELKNTQERISTTQTELEKKLDVRYVMFQYLDRQVQNHLDEHQKQQIQTKDIQQQLVEQLTKTQEELNTWNESFKVHHELVHGEHRIRFKRFITLSNKTRRHDKWNTIIIVWYKKKWRKH